MFNAFIIFMSRKFYSFYTRTMTMSMAFYRFYTMFFITVQYSTVNTARDMLHAALLLEKCAWFPKSRDELDLVAGNVVMYGPGLDADHPVRPPPPLASARAGSICE